MRDPGNGTAKEGLQCKGPGQQWPGMLENSREIVWLEQSEQEKNRG